MGASMHQLAFELDNDHNGRFPGRDRKDVAALLRWLADGHFVLLGYQRCSVDNGRSAVDPASRLGVLRLRQDVLPQLTHSDELLALAQATIPSYLRYGAYPYIVVVREQLGPSVIEHRFVGLFTVAATNANVLEIPLISGRVREALALSQRDPSHPGQLLLDIIQTIPARSCSRCRHGHCSTWSRRSSTSGRGAAPCCSCGPIRSPISSRVWCTCPVTATPPTCGWRCRTSWSASSAG